MTAADVVVMETAADDAGVKMQRHQCVSVVWNTCLLLPSGRSAVVRLGKQRKLTRVRHFESAAKFE